MKKTILTMAATLACAPMIAQADLASDVVENYADLAFATYNDALKTAQQLDAAIDELAANPSTTTLSAAKSAWITSRVPYQQSEVFRFGNSIVDDWEGQLNAWPLDEGLIDYVASGDYDYELGNPGATANIIANTKLTVGSDTLDLSKITPDLLAELNELGGSEANVATGYHAIEFLLWGQDLNGSESGAGERPYTDFVVGAECTGGHCARRVEFLQAASELLVNDLKWMTNEWKAGGNNYRAELLAESSESALRKVLFGMGSLSLGELAGERMKVALEANSTEDEHDCFSDNTHYSHFYNAKGVQNLYYGEFTATSGQTQKGPGIRDLLLVEDKKLVSKLDKKFKKTEKALQAIVDSAEKKDIHFDQLIAANNTKGAKIINKAINALVANTQDIELAAAALGISNLNPDTADHDF